MRNQVTMLAFLTVPGVTRTPDTKVQHRAADQWSLNLESGLWPLEAHLPESPEEYNDILPQPSAMGGSVDMERRASGRRPRRYPLIADNSPLQCTPMPRQMHSVVRHVKIEAQSCSLTCPRCNAFRQAMGWSFPKLLSPTLSFEVMANAPYPDVE